MVDGGVDTIYLKLDAKLDDIVKQNNANNIIVLEKINDININVAEIKQTVSYIDNTVKITQIKTEEIKKANIEEIKEHKSSVNKSISKIQDKLDSQTKLYKVIIIVTTAIGTVLGIIFIKLPAIIQKVL